MRFSLLGFLWLVTFTAIGIAAFTVRARPIISVLSLATLLSILFGMLSCILRKGNRRAYWIGFTMFSFGYYFWCCGALSREFYTVPGVIAEKVYGSHIYFEFSKYDSVEFSDYDSMSAATFNRAHYRAALGARVRFVANCMTAIYLGIVGGFAGSVVAKREPTVKT